MSKPKRQHIVPQFVLRNFVDNKGLLHRFRKCKPDEGIVSVTPKKAFVQTHVYSKKTAEHGRDVSLEESYSRLESDASTRIFTILSEVRNNRIPSFSPDDRDVLNRFFYHQWTRVPDVMDPIVKGAPFDGFIETTKFLATAVGASVSLEEEHKAKKDRDLILHNARVEALGETSPTAFPMIEQLGLTIAHIDLSECCFVVGSNPVVTTVSILSGHLNGSGVGITLPVAHDTALVFHGSSLEPRVDVIDSREKVGKFNEQVFEQSSEVASHSRQLLVSLVNGFKDRVR